MTLPYEHPYRYERPIFGLPAYTLWTPSDIVVSNWYDAEDEATITASSGKVSQWDDKSGNNNHVSQGTGSQQPATNSEDINGRNVIAFELANDQMLVATDDDSMDFDGGTGYATYAVLQKDDYVNQGSFANVMYGKGEPITAGSGWSVFQGGSEKVRLKAAFDGSMFSAASGLTNNVLISTNYTKSSKVGEIFIDGSLDKQQVLSSATNIDSTNSFGIGGQPGNSARFCDCKIGEIVVVPKSDSEAERQKVEGYLAHKWGLESNLPSDHPYKNTPPTI